MSRARRQARLLKATMQDAAPEWMPDFSLDRKIASARRQMGEAKWAKLNKEWETP